MKNPPKKAIMSEWINEFERLSYLIKDLADIEPNDRNVTLF